MASSIPESVTAEAPPAELSATLAGPSELSRRRLVVRRFLRHRPGMVGLALTLVLVGLGLLAPVLSPRDPFAFSGTPLASPSRGHLFGTDNLGRDLAGAVLHGLRTSATVVVWVVLISATLGVTIGALAGYAGRLVDDVLMRLTDLFQAVPRFFLVLLVLALFGTGTENMILILGLTSWPLLARVVRADTLSMRERPFIEAARSLGASHVRIVARHIVPNVVPAAVVVIALLASRVILLEASLSFLGLGDPSVMSLGFLIGNAQRFIRVAWWMSVFPGAVLALVVLGVNLLADGLNDVVAPTGHDRR
ncbi:MAG TPA: ABC transporter permease [Acidimicrobiales bacterium]|jgi:peptide/nickel transport system permease protein|nr:ABC transporter permease [Acidimicrobiales bacterium]